MTLKVIKDKKGNLKISKSSYCAKTLNLLKTLKLFKNVRTLYKDTNSS